MIQIRPTSLEKAPPGLLRSSQQALSDPKGVGHQSYAIWLVEDDEPLALVGLVRPSLLSAPDVWMLVYEALTKRPLKAVRVLRAALQMVRPQGPNAWTQVDRPEAVRFAELLGFRTVRSAGGWNQMRLI